METTPYSLLEPNWLAISFPRSTRLRSSSEKWLRRKKNSMQTAKTINGKSVIHKTYWRMLYRFMELHSSRYPFVSKHGNCNQFDTRHAGRFRTCGDGANRAARLRQQDGCCKGYQHHINPTECRRFSASIEFPAGGRIPHDVRVYQPIKPRLRAANIASERLVTCRKPKIPCTCTRTVFSESISRRAISLFDRPWHSRSSTSH